MRACRQVEIVTPKRVSLNGLLYGPAKAQTIYIFVHGLTGSLFSMGGLSQALAGNGSAVLTFNNRGFEQISSVKRRSARKTEYITAGTAHEVFEESVDDLQGAVHFARSQGYKRVYIVGHSTGCNKALFWATHGGKGANGIVLLGPLSDYSGALASKGATSLKRGVAHAQKLIAAGTPHALMPRRFLEWFECDAQRYVSLYSPDSSEEIFTYARPHVVPTTLHKTRLPILALLAGADEYGDMPAEYIASWFLEHIYEGEVAIIPNVGHSFKGAERDTAQRIRLWAGQ